MLPEGSVDRPVPTDEGHRGEEDEPEDGQTKVHTILTACSEVSQAGQHVEEESGTMDWRDTAHRKPMNQAESGRIVTNTSTSEKLCSTSSSKASPELEVVICATASSFKKELWFISGFTHKTTCKPYYPTDQWLSYSKIIQFVFSRNDCMQMYIHIQR